jgi:anti-sigma factor RsiW
MIELDCSGFAALVGGHVDGTLAAPEAAVLEKHASVCATCRARLDQLRGVDALLRRAPAPLPTKPEWDALLAYATRPAIRWRIIAAAALISVALPLSLGLLCRSSDAPAGCDPITPSLDTDL